VSVTNSRSGTSKARYGEKCVSARLNEPKFKEPDWFETLQFAGPLSALLPYGPCPQGQPLASFHMAFDDLQG
jgi:hypothetical protein